MTLNKQELEKKLYKKKPYLAKTDAIFLFILMWVFILSAVLIDHWFQWIWIVSAILCLVSIAGAVSK